MNYVSFELGVDGCSPHNIVDCEVVLENGDVVKPVYYDHDLRNWFRSDVPGKSVRNVDSWKYLCPECWENSVNKPDALCEKCGAKNVKR